MLSQSFKYSVPDYIIHIIPIEPWPWGNPRPVAEKQDKSFKKYLFKSSDTPRGSDPSFTTEAIYTL